MYTTYTLPNNTKIQGFFHNEWLKEINIKYLYDHFDWRKYKKDNEHIEEDEYTAKVTFINGIPTVTIYGFQVNLLNFDYHCIPILIEEIKYGIDHDDKWFVSENIIFSSLVKNHDRFGVKIKLDKFSLIVPELGFGIAVHDESNQDEVLCIPRFNRRDITDWHYKIAFWAKDEKMRTLYSGEEYYFSDFCSLLKDGSIELVEL